jgi:hypothetical protein
MKFVVVFVAFIIFGLPQVAYAAPGELNETCRPGPTNQCNTGLECNGGICTTPCGGPGQQCCQTTDLSRLCDIDYDVAFQNLRCTNVSSPSAGICQEVSCGDAGNACCNSGVACKASGVCSNSVCQSPIASPSATVNQPGAGQIIVPADPDARDFFAPNFVSVGIQAAFLVVTVALIFSVIGKEL